MNIQSVFVSCYFIWYWPIFSCQNVLLAGCYKARCNNDPRRHISMKSIGVCYIGCLGQVIIQYTIPNCCCWVWIWMKMAGTFVGKCDVTLENNWGSIYEIRCSNGLTLTTIFYLAVSFILPRRRIAIKYLLL